MTSQNPRSGMTTFLIVWLGQIVSQLGSAMTGFGVSIWLYQQTGLASTLTFAAAAFFAPQVFLSPIAGTIVDRSNRKLIMILTDLISGATTIIMLFLLWQGQLEAWHIYLLNFVNGTFASLQWPAFSASITLLVSKENYARTSGLMQIGGPAAQIFAPAAAAALIGWRGFETVLLFDVVTFIVAVGALLLVRIPQPPISAESKSAQGSFWAETKLGFTYILARPSLLGLQLVFMGVNLVASFGFAIITPMILARTNNNEAILATTMSIGATGGVVGGLALGAWGGPKRKTDGVLGGMISNGLLGPLIFGLSTTPFFWALAGFLSNFTLPFINGSNQAIWQAKVPPDLQGRVFSVRRLIAQVLGPISTVIAGPLADTIFEPAMMEGGALVAPFGWAVGTGPGAGMGLMMALSGIAAVIVALIGYTSATVRDAETLLPDHTTAS